MNNWAKTILSKVELKIGTMKIYNMLTSLLLLVICCTAIHSQEKSLAESEENHKAVYRYVQPKQLAPDASLLFLDMKNKSKLEKLKQKFPLILTKGEYFISALMKVSAEFELSQLEDSGIIINTVTGSIISVLIPLEVYGSIVNIENIEYIELAKKVYSKLEKALESSKVDLVHSGIGLSRSYTGDGVVVGVLDLGFDYTHPAFTSINNGTLRIKRSWEQNIDKMPPRGYSYGNELSGSELLDEKFDASHLGHGTHVANVAAGSDNNFNGKYQGVAFNSDLVLVSLLQLDGISGLNTGVIDGIDYVFKYAASVGKPAVVNLSQGHHTGPHDGTSLTDQAIDELSGSGKIIVGAVGNEGDNSGFYLHFDHTFNNENEILSYLVWPDELSAGKTVLDIWGEAGESFEVVLEVYNPRTKIMEAQSEAFSSKMPITFTKGMMSDLENDMIRFEGAIEINPLNNRPHIAIYINSTEQSTNGDVNTVDLLDNDFIRLRFTGTRGTVHAYSSNNSGGAFFTDLSGVGANEFINGVRVLGGNSDNTMGELGGTAHSIISVGGYTTKNVFTNTAMQQLGTEDVIDDYYFKSSRGPTHDGRIKPDISAPANLIAGAANSFNTNFDSDIEVDKIDKPTSGKWSYSIRRGTSISSPLVSGIVALMLEMDPGLTPEKVKEYLISNADQDQFTGPNPNNIWGHGKVNAVNVLADLENIVSNEEVVQNLGIRMFPNPTRDIITIEFDIRQEAQMKLFDLQGRLVLEKKLEGNNINSTVDVSGIKTGIYLIEVAFGGSVYQDKVVVAY